jgi:hypothetical protein
MIPHRYTCQRLQTNAEWNSIFQFVSGKDSLSPPQPISDWTLTGIAKRINKANIELDITPRMTIGDDPSQLTISLSTDDTAYLGVGIIVFEVLRIDPLPLRPILRFYINNYLGIANPVYVMPVTTRMSRSA